MAPRPVANMAVTWIGFFSNYGERMELVRPRIAQRWSMVVQARVLVRCGCLEFVSEVKHKIGGNQGNCHAKTFHVKIVRYFLDTTHNICRR